jgi:predicted TIM-barrel fold metal-dependent hydrolase
MPFDQPLPQPMLMVEKHEVRKPRFPAIDAHNHLGQWFGGEWRKRPACELLDVLDEAGVRTVVDLDGGFGDDFQREMDKWGPLGDRVLVFAGVAWKRLAASPILGERAALEFERAVKAGARGLKVWKDLGLQVKDRSRRLIPVDTRRLDPLWAKAGELGVPVIIHVGDPLAFFEPPDASNERWDELQRNPEWGFYGPGFPRLEVLIQGMENVIARHPGTEFIGAHVGCYAENLAYVAGMLDRLPNYHIDFGARIAELGRQPHTARRFFLRYADRILFGTDCAPDPESYRIYYRFLETDDDYFPYWHPADRPWQGQWYIYGLGLPDSVLYRIYCGNAERLLKLPGLEGAAVSACQADGKTANFRPGASSRPISAVNLDLQKRRERNARCRRDQGETEGQL